MGTEAEKRITECVLGIPVFTWTGWDIAGDQTLQFYDCEFLLPELEQYNDWSVCVDHGWNNVTVYRFDKYGLEVEVEINILKIDSFLNAISKK